MKTKQEVIDFLKSKGFEEYANAFGTYRSLELNWREGKYSCELNERSPGIHAHVHELLLPNKEDAHYSVDFCIVGEFHGQWVDLKIYGISFNEIEKELDNSVRRLKVLWKAYCEEI